MKNLQAIIKSSISNTMLHLIILPTEACNFRCVYCYETFKYNRMNAEVIEGIKNLISMRIPDLKYLHISWFGGEPLLTLSIIEDISGHILELLEKNPKCQFRADMTTNAYCLGPSIFNKLCRFKVGLYQITFDGPRELHNKKRILANGSGTFDQIWENLLNLKKTDKQVSFLIRLHLDKDNFPCIYAFLDEYRRDFSNDNRFKLFLRPLSKLGGQSDEALHTFNNERERKEAVEELKRYMERNGIQHKAAMDLPGICYASKLNSFVLRTNGNINKCTVALDREYNQVGSIYQDGTLEIEKETLFRWCRGLQSGNEKELLCPLENFCST